MRASLLTTSLLLLGFLSACDDAGAGHVLAVDARGRLLGGVYVDANGSGAPDAGDRVLPGVEVQLLTPGGGTVIARAVSDTAGEYLLSDVPVGRYELKVTSARFGDSLSVITPLEPVNISPADTLALVIGVSYPTATVAEARNLPVGSRVFVEGRVLAVYGDTVHVGGSTGAIRVTRVRGGEGIAAVDLLGDSVRVSGSAGRSRGQATLDGGILIPLAALNLPEPDVMTSAAAAGANGGRADAAQVQVRNVTLVDTVRIGGIALLRLDDGSGPVDVWLGAGVQFARSGFIPGTVLNISGVLIPADQEGVWWIRPRLASDLVWLSGPSPLRLPTSAGLATRAFLHR